MTNPTAETERNESLDVLRGFALLGILLLNIIGFGLPGAAYSYPGGWITGNLDLFVWGGVELFAEGAMRCLFSMLFGAGVALFTTGQRAKSGAIHYKRNFWLLVLGLIDAYLLLWNGDILINYALGGFVLYWVREVSARRLLIASVVLLSLLTAFNGLMGWGMQQSESAWLEVQAAAPTPVTSEQQALADTWEEFTADYLQEDAAILEELAARRGSYVSAFWWNVGVTNNMLFFVLPLFLFWDALVMMLLGMALYKYAVLEGGRSKRFYQRLMLVGFSVGLLVNGYEVARGISNDFSLLSTFAQMQPTYHLGRLATALGWLGLLMLLLQSDYAPGLRTRLAAVGRMALTNYLSHSIICLFIFTGAGLGMVGTLPRAELYWVVLGIWCLQLWLSPWWLARFRFGPVEWLWRGLTYGTFPDILRRDP